MPIEDRLTALCEQAPPLVTGIDFIQVVQPHVQTLLRVFFVVDPDTLSNPMVATAAMPVLMAPPQSVEIVSTTGGERLARVPVVSATWRRVSTAIGVDRTVLDVAVAEPGDFSPYRLTIVDPGDNRVDRFFNGVVFSFKQGCPSVFDCRRLLDCPPEEMVDWPVDYLARDFESLRNALLDFSAQRYPLWRERIPADQAVMLMELAAALGDEFAYIQDRIAREAHLETLVERRSLRRHARLVDYDIDDGASAATVLDIELAPGQQDAILAGIPVWATPEGEPPVPFTLGTGLADQLRGTSYWVSAAWNAMPVHVPDPSAPCLPAGSTELYLVGEFPLASQLPLAADPLRFWIDRPMLLRTDPADPAEPSRRHIVHITEVEVTTDPLVLEAGVPITITRIAWRPDDALPFDLCLSDATVHGNIVPATAGRTVVEYFAVADHSAVALADRPRVALAVERQGPLPDIEPADRPVFHDAAGRFDFGAPPVPRVRPPIFLHSLAETERQGIGMIGGVPEVALREVDDLASLLTQEDWRWVESMIEARSEEPRFTLDDGTWRKIITFDRIGGQIIHVDRASSQGFTIRFGDGEFGRIPADGALFEATYRTGGGTRANLPSESVRAVRDPLSPATPSPLDIAQRVSNPFEITSGRDPQDAATVKQIAPEAYRAEPRRAVRDEDYRALAEKLPWVQRAGAVARWTGSWLTEFVTADPEGSFELSAERRAELEREMDCVRQAGRPVVVRDPVFVAIDLRIRICVRPEAYEGQVIERVTQALVGRRRPGRPIPFFDPDNFTFGQPLSRAALEAAIQNVPGVLGVDEIMIRVRGTHGWKLFDSFLLHLANDRILRLENDPDRPEAGSLIVTTRTLVP
jgi:hypothetical protein